MRRWVPFLALCGVLAAVGRAAEKPQDPGLVERVTVRLVQLNFLAVDDQGRPVTDLHPEEIELRVDGTVTPLAFLQAYAATPAVRAKPAEAHASPEAESAPAPAADIPRQRWIVLFFDHVNASPRTRLGSLEAAREFLGTHVGPGDRVAIAVFDARLRIVQNFTSDAARLRASLSELEETAPRAAPERARGIDQLVDELENCRGRGQVDLQEVCATQVITAYEDERYRELDAFTAAVRWVLYATAPIPDVKTVVLFSEGVPRVPSRDGSDAADAVLGSRSGRIMGARPRAEAEDRFDSIAEAAALAKAAVFTINPGGMSRMASISAARPGLAGGATNALQIDPWRSAERNAQQSLHEISWRTGGTATQSADIGEALERIDAVSSALYTLGYYARPDVKVPAKVKIRILRKDVRAEFQRDVPPPPPDRAPLGGELSVDAGPCGENGRRVVTLRVRVDRSSLTFTRIAGNMVANFSLLVRLTPTTDAAPAFEDFRTLNLANPVREHEAGTLPDPAVEIRVPLDCGAYAATVTAVDAGSGSRKEFTAAIEE